MRSMTFSCSIHLNNRSSRNVLLAWMMDWKGRLNFLMATRLPVFAHSAALKGKLFFCFGVCLPDGSICPSADGSQVLIVVGDGPDGSVQLDRIKPRPRELLYGVVHLNWQLGRILRNGSM